MSTAPTVAELQQATNLSQYVLPGRVRWSRWADDAGPRPEPKRGTQVYYHVAHLPQRHLPDGMGPMDLSYLYRYRLPVPRLLPPRPQPWQSDLRTLFPVTKYGRWPRDPDGQRWMLLRRLNEYWQNGLAPRVPDALRRWVWESR